MTDAFLQLPLTQMVDLVINSPEEGVVNFNLLHAVLHVIVKELNAQDVSVELQGPNAQRLQNIIKTDAATGPSLNVTVVGKKDAGTGTKTDKKDTATETVYIVQPTESSANCGMTVTKKQLNEMSEEIVEIKEKLQELTDLPGNMGIINAVRTEAASPVIDMFQILSLTKRIDAAEIGMNKLASIVEDLIKNPAYADRGTCTKAPKGSTQQLVAFSPETPAPVDDEELRNKLNGMSPNDAIAFLLDELNNLKDLLGPMFCGTDEDRMSIDELFNTVAQLRDKFFRKKPSTTAIDGAEECDTAEADGGGIDLPPDVQLALLEERFAEYTKHIENMDRTFNDELSKLHNQFTDIEKDFNEILLKIQGGLPAGDSDSTQCCASVYNKIAKLQADFEALTEESSKLIEDKDEKTEKMDLMLEQIELLKTIKADKEDVEEALAEKADACTVLRKVSHAQFDNACDELTRGIEDALLKLTQQEELWQHALEDIQNEIGTKLDKMDLGPLREFINNKLRQLQDKMRSLAALKREQEAAGTKSKLLRDVNCISCDKDVVMRKEMDPSLKPPAYSAPPTRSMAPYLAYELDALRKQQKGVPGAKNMNNLEAALGAKGGKKADDHICNRYCGGSHTVTTPQQRVTRLGHFLLQWGPEGIPKDEAKAKSEKEVQTRSQSVTIQGDILSARKSSVMHTDSPRGSATKIRSSRVSAVKGSASAKSLSGDDKRPSQTKQGSNVSVRSARMSKKVSKVMEEIVEVPAEEGPSEAQEPPTESESLAPPPTMMEGAEGAEAGEVPAEAAPAAEEQGQVEGEAPPAAAEEEAAAAPPPAEAEAPPPEEE